MMAQLYDQYQQQKITSVTYSHNLTNFVTADKSIKH